MKWPWKRKRVVVLGAELAAAHKAEEERIAAGVSGPSPLPDDRYHLERGDYDLVAVAPLQLDQDIRSFTNDFRVWDADRRREVMQALSFDDLYTLIHYVKRASVIALNREAVEWCGSGLAALSLIDETRVDLRDVKWSAGILEHAILTKDVADDLIESTHGITPSTLAFLRRLPKVSRLSDWGYAEIRKDDVVGLIRHGYSKYNPTVDLTSAALQISEQLTQGRYVGEVEIATDVPEIWFARERRDEARSKLANCLGAASIHGTLRDEYSSHGPQMFVEWIVEMPSPDACEYLVEAVRPGTPLSGRYALGVSEANLFALLVAGSAREGVEPFESQSSLRELGEQTKVVFKSAVAESDEH